MMPATPPLPPPIRVETSFTAPKSPELKPGLKERLFVKPEKSIVEVERKIEEALRRKRMLLQATIEQASKHNKRVRQVVSDTKKQQEEKSAATMAKLSARLEAATERRVSRNSSPVASPLSSPQKLPVTGDRFALPPAITQPVRLTVSVPAADQSTSVEATLKEKESPAGAEDAQEVEKQPKPLHEEIASQLAATEGEFVKLAQWVKEPATIGLVAEWLSTLGIDRTLAKRLLALVCMAHDAEQMFDDSDADRLMAREASRFKDKLEAQLKRGAAAARKEPFAVSFTRARRFYAAWSAQDMPKQARVVDEAVQRLRDALMRRRAQHAHEGTEPIPPEDLLAQIRALAGDQAEAEARALFLRPWEPVGQGEEGRVGLEARVREVATRAMWDVVKAQVASGEYTGLFSALGELQQAMSALVAHSERAREELSDQFDAKWIEQQANAGCLSTEQVQALMRFLTERIASWQAPADDGDTRVWVDATERVLTATVGMELTAFISAHLVDFLAGAMERLGKVVQRVLALSHQE